MRILMITLILALAGCQSPKKDFDFTFYNWNIHESYYLKFNSSDTIYFINVYPHEEGTFYTILNNEEKERIQNILDTITFPKKEKFENYKGEDGETNVFYLKKNKKIKIHSQKEPIQFWLFGKSLKEIKSKHKFTQTNKKFNLNEINKMLNAPPPPIINE